MASATISAVRRTKMTMDASFFITTTGKKMEIPLALGIPVPYTQGTLLVRVHQKTATNANDATFTISVKNMAPTDEDPAIDFVGSELASVLINNTVTAPALLEGPTTWTSANKPGGTVGVFLIITTGTTSTAVAITLVISVDLVLKS